MSTQTQNSMSSQVESALAKQAQNRFTASLIEPFPIFSPSPKALARINALQLADPKESSQTMYDILVQDQSEHGLRVHKGYPLYWLALTVGESDKSKALELMLAAFAEDVLTHGERSYQGFAAESLRHDFGIDPETLAALKVFLTEKAMLSFYPIALVREFFDNRKRYPTIKKEFRGVTEESPLESIVLQVETKLRDHLKASFRAPPGDEMSVQDVVHALLRQVDEHTNREKKGARLANKEFTIDFSLYEDKVGVEVKLVDKKEKLSQTIDQISADIPAYSKYFKRTIFLIYDVCNAITDVKRLIRELTGDRKEIEVLVIS